MKEKIITIAGQKTGAAYCYATEIAFSRYTGKNIEDAFREGQPVSPEDVLYLILSAIVAYYESRNEQPPVESTSVIYKATPQEITSAVTEITNLRLAWYNLPPLEKIKADKEAEKAKEEGEGKN